MTEQTDDERKIKAVEKVLGEPVFLEFADATLKARRNLLAFATIAIAFAWWHLALSSNPTLFGVQVQNLSNDVLAWGLLWVVLYLLVHFVWLAWDALEEWRLRQSGMRITAANAGVWRNSPDDDAPNDPRHSTLYTWWFEQSRHLQHSKKLADDTRSTLGPWIERGLPGDVDDQTKAQLLTISTNVAALQGAIAHATTVLESHRPTVSLQRFEGAYQRFARSQNLRWIVIEFGLPVLVGVGGLVACASMILHPVKASPAPLPNVIGLQVVPASSASAAASSAPPASAVRPAPPAAKAAGSAPSGPR